MQIHISPTTKIVTLNGVPARVWEGQSDEGHPIHCYVTRIAIQSDLMDMFSADPEPAIFTDLMECTPPSPEVASIPSRLIL